MKPAEHSVMAGGRASAVDAEIGVGEPARLGTPRGAAGPELRCCG